MAGPLSGIKVLDLGAYGVGPAACGLLGMMGAKVIRIEPHTGDGLMFVASKIGGMGTAYIGVHFNKESIVLNLQDDADKEIALKLVAWADVLVENRRFGTMKKLGFDYDTVASVNPNLIYISSPAYGTSGPLVNYAGADHYIQAASGFVQLNGQDGGAAEVFRNVSYLDMTNTSVIQEAALVGLLARQKMHRGLYITTSSFNGGIILQTTRLAEFFATKITPKRMGSANPNIVPSQAFKTLDNSYILVSVQKEEHWYKLCQALEIEEIQGDPLFNTNVSRVQHRSELIPKLEAKFKDKPRMWWLIHLRRHGVPCGYVAYFDDIARDPQVMHDQQLVEKDTPWGRALYIDAPWRFSRTETVPVEATHYPDSDREEILNLVVNVVDQKSVKDQSFNAPLEGVRIVDLSEDIAGAYCSQSLADAGAEVIKVENIKGDAMRHIGQTINGESSLFMSLNRNKHSIALDTSSEVGKEIIYRMVKEADIFIESHGSGIADKMDLGYDKLRSLRNNLVYCSISPFGEDGPYRERPASELELQGLAGVIQFLGEIGEPPVRLGSDAVSIAAGIHAASAILAALYYREQTGIGQKVSVSMLNVALWLGRTWLLTQHNPEYYGGYFLTGPFDSAETGYKTKDKPIMFGLFTNTEERSKLTWEKFCQNLGLEGLLVDPYFAEHGPRTLGMGRDAQEMKPFFESAFENWKASDLIEMIHGIGGMGAEFMTYEELFSDPPHPQVIANRMVVSFDHPRAGKTRTVAAPFEIEGFPKSVRMPPPLIGEHTKDVLVSLGYSSDQIFRFRESGWVTFNTDSDR